MVSRGAYAADNKTFASLSSNRPPLVERVEDTVSTRWRNFQNLSKHDDDDDPEDRPLYNGVFLASHHAEPALCTVFATTLDHLVACGWLSSFRGGFPEHIVGRVFFSLAFFLIVWWLSAAPAPAALHPNAPC